MDEKKLELEIFVVMGVYTILYADLRKPIGL